MNNGRRHPGQIKEKANFLRKNGLTHREIAKELGIAGSTAYLWTKGINLTTAQKKATQKRKHKQIFTFERRKKLSQLARINLSPFWKKPCSKKELITKIQKFYLKNGRIPLKKEFSAY